jgi:hyaluronoglucosaminidase
MLPPLGLIEGYYGRPWTWAERADQAAFMGRHGFDFYIYAPKADAHLRKRWREPWPAATRAAVEAFAGQCRAAGVRFGVGLSPFEIYRDFGEDAQAALAAKLAELDGVGVEILGILFDDMRGDLPDVAANQIRIMHWIAERTGAKEIIFCPTYYSDDPELDTAFGNRPPDYLTALGAGLDPAIQIFWTGEEVCAREFSPGHLARVAEAIGRKPFLWDNYPVNDGPRMSPYLYIRAFTGRPGAIGEQVAGHAINPALQPYLSRIPMLSLAESYREGDAYEYFGAFDRAASEVLGPDLARHVRRHVRIFHDTGVDRLDAESVAKLRGRYSIIDHPAAREITAWLDGAYRITADMLEAES